MDELLKNVCLAKENQSINFAMENPSHWTSRPVSWTFGLPQQGSPTVTQELSRKTVDEVWRDIRQSQRKNDNENKVQDQQFPVGEMTLEDFLVKAGVVSEDASKNGGGRKGVENLEISYGGGNANTMMVINPIVDHNFQRQGHPLISSSSSQQQIQSKNQDLKRAYMHDQPIPAGVTGVPVLDLVFTDNNQKADTQTPGRKRVASDEVIEKTVERKQKRMIKNRESAARSRARKQAYTHELENKVSRLEEENEMLRKQKTLQNILYAAIQPQPKSQLHRSNSALF